MKQKTLKILNLSKPKRVGLFLICPICKTIKAFELRNLGRGSLAREEGKSNVCIASDDERHVFHMEIGKELQ
ncbi:MAG: hypothetical protein ACR2LN_01080 [Candidatus Levyibacteriota bacterium]